MSLDFENKVLSDDCYKAFYLFVKEMGTLKVVQNRRK